MIWSISKGSSSSFSGIRQYSHRFFARRRISSFEDAVHWMSRSSTLSFENLTSSRFENSEQSANATIVVYFHLFVRSQQPVAIFFSEFVHS